MAIYQHQFHDPPLGHAPAWNKGRLPENLAQIIKGFLSGRNGFLEVSPPLVNGVATSAASTISGIAWYFNPYPPTQEDVDAGQYRLDKLLLLRGGIQLWSYDVGYDQTINDITIGDANYVGDIPDIKDGLDIANQNLRSVGYQGELFLVAGDGCLPYRYYMDAAGAEFLVPVGIIQPATPTTALDGAGVLTGDYDYLIVYKDERGRPSSPSLSPTTITTAANQVEVTFTWGTETQVASVEIYRTAKALAGNVPVTPFYLVATITNTATTTYTDNTPDIDIVNATNLKVIADDFGASEPPHRAAKLCIREGAGAARLILDDKNLYDDDEDIESVTRLQASNLTSLTGFSALNWITVGNDRGDDVSQLCELASILHVWSRSAIYQIPGKTPPGDAERLGLLDDVMRADFLEAVGCPAPDTVVKCGQGAIRWLGTDGWKEISYASGFRVKSIGHPIDDFYLRGRGPVAG